jgi:hypothetical protein
VTPVCRWRFHQSPQCRPRPSSPNTHQCNSFPSTYRACTDTSCPVHLMRRVNTVTAPLNSRREYLRRHPGTGSQPDPDRAGARVRTGVRRPVLTAPARRIPRPLVLPVFPILPVAGAPSRAAHRVGRFQAGPEGAADGCQGGNQSSQLEQSANDRPIAVSSKNLVSVLTEPASVRRTSSLSRSRGRRIRRRDRTY